MKGKKQKLEIYELVGMQKEVEVAPTPAEIELCRAFTEAYNAFYAGKMEEAKKTLPTNPTTLSCRRPYPNLPRTHPSCKSTLVSRGS